MRVDSVDRRTWIFRALAIGGAAPLVSLVSADGAGAASDEGKLETKLMKIHYLEIVTPDVDASVALYEANHGVSFGQPIPGLGGARTATLEGGGLLGIRGPLRETEDPVVRPYYLVDAIETAVEAASRAGAQVAMGPTEIPGYGQFAIFILGGIETGLWQL